MLSVDKYKLQPSPDTMAADRSSNAYARPSLFDSDRPFDFQAYVAHSTQNLDPSLADPSNESSPSSFPPSVSHQRPKRQSYSDENPPSWADMKTKAGKDRKRLPLACIACRRKKIRCSGEKPACKHCLKVRVPCVYKITSRKAAPRTDYMAMLDKRLKRMEDRVIRTIPKDQDRPDLPRASVKPDFSKRAPAASSNSNTKKRTAQEAFGQQLDEWAKSAGQASDPRAGYLVRPEEREEAELLDAGREDLPSSDICEHLIDVFFDYVYGQSYIVLHKPSFIRALKDGTIPPCLLLAMCATSARFSNHPKLQQEDEPPFLRGDSWAAEAQKIALSRYDSPNLYVCWTLLMLALHTFGTCQGGKSWMLAGMAHRMAYALQLHKDPETDLGSASNNRNAVLSFTDREIRRRTMWACFMMDRLNSSGTERPMFAAEENMHIRLPIKEDMFRLEMSGLTEYLNGEVEHLHAYGHGLSQVSLDPGDKVNMGISAYMVRAIALWGQWNQYLNLGGRLRDKHSCAIWHPDSGWSNLWRRFESFTDSLPNELHFTPENVRTHAADGSANQYLLLHIVINQTMIFANRFAYPAIATILPPKEAPKEFCDNGSKLALQGARQISRICEIGQEYRLTAPFAGHAAYISGSIHVHGVFSSDPELAEESKRLLTINIKFLTRLRRYWGMLGFVLENLKELYVAHLDAARKGISLSAGRLGARRALQYGDWYDKYPRGVSKTDFVEPVGSSQTLAGPATTAAKEDNQSVEDYMANQSSSIQEAKSPNSRRKITRAQPTPRQPQAVAKDGSSSQQQQQQQQQRHTAMHGNFGSTNFPSNESYERTQIRGQMPAGMQQGASMQNSYASAGYQEPSGMMDVGAGYASNLDPSLMGHTQGGMAGWTGVAEQSSDGWLMGPEPSGAWFQPYNLDPNYIAAELQQQPNNVFDQWNGFPGLSPTDSAGMSHVG